MMEVKKRDEKEMQDSLVVEEGLMLTLVASIFIVDRCLLIATSVCVFNHPLCFPRLPQVRKL